MERKHWLNTDQFMSKLADSLRAEMDQGIRSNL
jgi:hypothetical protein